MDKKVLLVVAALVVAGGLSGCGNQQKADQNNYQAETPVPQVQEQAATPVTTTEESVDVDQEVKAIDASMDTVKDTGFTDDNLSNKDLGI